MASLEGTRLTFRWSKMAPRVYLCERSVKIDRDEHRIVFRVDGRDGYYRVDRYSLCLWEAIDGGKGFKLLADAKTYVDAWIRAAQEQRDLCPRMAG